MRRRKPEKPFRLTVEFVGFLQWWDEQSYSTQQAWLKAREKNFRYRGDSNYLVALFNQKEPHR
jgi:hypothetical protein